MATKIPPRPDGTKFGPWFKGSKVVGETGKPLRMFHGFLLGAEYTTKKYIYFAFGRSLAEMHGDEPGGGVVTAYLSLKNPLILTTGEQVRDMWADSGALEIPGAFMAQQMFLNEWVEAQGYDGIMVMESAFEGDIGYEHAACSFGEPQIVAFSPDQVWPLAVTLVDSGE